MRSLSGMPSFLPTSMIGFIFASRAISMSLFTVAMLKAILMLGWKLGGAGKTTLLRIFTPSILTLIERRNKQDDHYSLLYEKLYELDVFNINGPNVISSLISFNDFKLAICLAFKSSIAVSFVFKTDTLE